MTWVNTAPLPGLTARMKAAALPDFLVFVSMPCWYSPPPKGPPYHPLGSPCCIPSGGAAGAAGLGSSARAAARYEPARKTDTISRRVWDWGTDMGCSWGPRPSARRCDRGRLYGGASTHASDEGER